MKGLKERLETVSISNDKSVLLKRALNYLLISILLVLFNFVYSLFAHGVSSLYMQYAFLLPLTGGSLLCMLMIYLPKPGFWVRHVWRMGLVTLIIGFILHGVFDIYGSESELVKVIFYIGYGLLSTGFIMYIINVLKVIQKKHQN